VIYGDIMKLTAAQLLGLAADAMKKAANPGSFGANAMLRKLVQVRKLATDTGLGNVAVEMPEPLRAQRPPKAPVSKKAQRRGGTEKHPVPAVSKHSTAEQSKGRSAPTTEKE